MKTVLYLLQASHKGYLSAYKSAENTPGVPPDTVSWYKNHAAEFEEAIVILETHINNQPKPL